MPGDDHGFGGRRWSLKKDSVLDSRCAGGADLNLEVEGVPLVKLALQNSAWNVARCLLGAGASWPFVFDTKLYLNGKAYDMPHTQLPSKLLSFKRRRSFVSPPRSAHFKFCKAVETGNEEAAPGLVGLKSCLKL